VVTGVNPPELEEPDEVVLDAVLVVAATVVVLVELLLTSAGSFPDTSCTKIPPVVTRNVVVAIATTRLRIDLTRCLRARSRSATRPSVARGFERGAGRLAPGNVTALDRASGGVIVAPSGERFDHHRFVGPPRNDVRTG
jgi:hypothetical protein